MYTMTLSKSPRKDHNHSVDATDFRPHESAHHHHQDAHAVTHGMVAQREDAHH